MSNELPIPDELQHLIEKREQSDRREGERRQTETADDAIQSERRSIDDRRQTIRRQNDLESATGDQFIAGDEPGPGRYVCLSCGRAVILKATRQPLPSCASCLGNQPARFRKAAQ